MSYLRKQADKHHSLILPILLGLILVFAVLLLLEQATYEYHEELPLPDGFGLA
jgi:hypothetical protein